MRIETENRRKAAQQAITDLAEEIGKTSMIAMYLEPTSASDKHNNRLWWEEKANHLMALGKEITCDDKEEIVEQPRLMVGNLITFSVKGGENNPVIARYINSTNTHLCVTMKSILRFRDKRAVLMNEENVDFQKAEIIGTIEVINL